MKTNKSANETQTEIEVAIGAKLPLLWVVSVEEEIAEQSLCFAASNKKSQIYFWDYARGWSDSGAGKGNAMQGLERVKKAPGDTSAIFVMKDLANLIAPGANGQITSNQVPIVREIKNLAREINRDKRLLVLLSDQLRIPLELKQESTIAEFSYPDRAEISSLIEELLRGRKRGEWKEFKSEIAKACQGLSRCQIAQILAKCLETGKLDSRAVEVILDKKRQIIRETGILEFMPIDFDWDLQKVGGLENLKEWVRMRSRNFSDAAVVYGLPAPKGLLLAGIQGTGKSLSAKTIAAEWKLPLLRLDAGRLFGGIVGESEGNIRQVISLVEAIAPCVLWMD